MGELQDISRERINQCTLDEIEHSGIVGLRVANIAEAADVSVALIYKYYKDRDGLLAAVLGKEITKSHPDEKQQRARNHQRHDQLFLVAV